MGGGRPGTEAAAGVLWTAAADAMVWTAMIREHDSWTELKRAWAAKAEAVDAMRAGSEECGRAVDAQGVVDAGALGRAAEALGHAAAAMGRAAEAFDRASDLCKAAGAGLRRAGDAHARALDKASAVDMRGMASMSYDRAARTDQMTSNARGMAAGLAREADGMAALAAGWAGAGQRRWSGERGGLAAVQADMWEDAKEMRAGSEEMKRSAQEAERLAARMRDVAAGAAERSAERAAAAARGGLAGQDAPEAAAAWRKAVSEAHAAEDEAGGTEEGGA